MRTAVPSRTYLSCSTLTSMLDTRCQPSSCGGVRGARGARWSHPWGRPREQRAHTGPWGEARGRTHTQQTSRTAPPHLHDDDVVDAAAVRVPVGRVVDGALPQVNRLLL